MPERRNTEAWAAGLAFAVGAALAVLARGLAGDEEPGHYLIARYAPVQPSLFLSMSGRPLVTLALALPSQAGFLAARLAAAAFTAAAAYALARLARRTGWVGPFWMVALFLVQPFLIAHAATAMTEPIAAALVAWGILAVAEKRWLLLAVLGALLPLARFETVVFWPAVVWLLWRGGSARLLLLLPVPLLAWNLLGGIPAGDPLWLLHQSSWRAYPQRDYFHYVMSYVWIVGLGLFVPILASLPVPRLRGRGKARGEASEPEAGRAAIRVRVLAASWTVVGVFFVVYTALAVWHPVTFGNLRYFAYAAPAFALLAGAGLHRLEGERSRWTLGVLGAALVGAVLLWNHPLVGDFGIVSRWYLLPLAVAALWLLVYSLPAPARRFAPLLAVTLGVVGLVRNHRDTLHLEPREEHLAMREMAGALARPLPEGIQLYSAHPMLAFYRGENPYDRDAYGSVTNRIAQHAGPGSLLLWDSHYAWRRGQTLGLEEFLPRREWRYVSGLVAPDSSFAAAYFLRVDPGDSAAVPAGSQLVDRAPGDPEAWSNAAYLIQMGVPAALRTVREDPRSARSWHGLASTLARVGRIDEAWKALAEAERLSPRDPYNKGFEAELHRLQGNAPAAVEAAREAVALDPDNGEFQFLLAMNLLKAKQRAEAEPYLTGAARRLPKRADVQYQVATYYLEEKQWGRAEPYLAAALALQPLDARATVLYAEVALRTGRPQVAESRLRAFVRDHPTIVFPYLALSDLLVGLRRPQEARALLRDALQKTGGDPEIASRLESLGP